MVVSHDRAFLDRVVTHVAELDAHDHTISMFAGGWAAYLHERELARRHAEAAYAEFEDQRATLRSRAQREREWAHQGVAKEKKAPRDNDKVGRDFRKNQTERLAAKARRTEQAMARLDDGREAVGGLGAPVHGGHRAARVRWSRGSTVRWCSAVPSDSGR